MSALFAMQGGNIVYSSQLEKGSGLYYTPPLEAFWLPCGRFFPVSPAGFNLLEHFLTGEALPRESAHQTTVLGVIMTPNGLVYEYGNGYMGIYRRIIPMGKGLVYCRSVDMSVEEAMTAAMTVHDQLVDAITLVAKSRKLLSNQYSYTTIDKVYDEMKERKIILQPTSTMAW